MSIDKFELPDEVRQALEKGVTQAREGFDKAMTAATEAMSTIESKAGAAQSEALELRKKGLAFTENAIASAFDLAKNLISAKSVEEAIKLQTSYVTNQVSTLSGHLSEAGAEFQKKAQSLQEELTAEANKAQAKAKEAVEQGLSALKDANPFGGKQA
ncbi:MAG: phasin family protein [Proteobacteria bacterium]|nr:phasin family protein [Pseudomonadota bacterium]